MAVAAAVDPAGDRAASPGVNQAVSQVDSEPISRAVKVAPLEVAVPVRDAPPMIVRNAPRVRWARLSPKKSTLLNLTQLF